MTDKQYIKKPCDGLKLSYYDLKLIVVALALYQHSEPHDKEVDERAKQISDDIVEFGKRMINDM